MSRACDGRADQVQTNGEYFRRYGSRGVSGVGGVHLLRMLQGSAFLFLLLLLLISESNVNRGERSEPSAKCHRGPYLSHSLGRFHSPALFFFFLPFLFSFYYLLMSSSHCLIPARRPQRQYRPIFHFMRCPLRRSLFPHLPLPFVCFRFDSSLHSPSASILVCHTLSTLSPRGHVWPFYLFWPPL